MNRCLHHWTHLDGTYNMVVCSICGTVGQVEYPSPKTPNHLELAREDYGVALLLGRGNSTYLARLEGAIGHVICYLEEKKD